MENIIKYCRIIAIIFAMIISITADARNKKEGYLIVTQKLKPARTEIIRDTSIARIDSIATLFIPGLKGVENILQHSVFLNIETDNSRLYIEKKMAVITRKGKLKLKKWKVKR